MKQELENLLRVIDKLPNDYDRCQLKEAWGKAWDKHYKTKEKDVQGQFCVVGLKCGKVGRNTPRQWFDTQDSAIEHARSIINRQRSSTPFGRMGPQSFFVAKAVLVVEPDQHAPPPVVTRLPVKGDF